MGGRVVRQNRIGRVLAFTVLEDVMMICTVHNTTSVKVTQEVQLDVTPVSTLPFFPDCFSQLRIRVARNCSTNNAPRNYEICYTRLHYTLTMAATIEKSFYQETWWPSNRHCIVGQ